MVQPWVPMLWHQDQSWLLIIHVLGGTAPRKAAPYDQTWGGRGRESWTSSWFPLQTPFGIVAAPWQATMILLILRFSGLCSAGFSTALPITETLKSWGCMINLTATTRQHEYGAAPNPCLANAHGMILTLQHDWCFGAFVCNKSENVVQLLKTSACECFVLDPHCSLS